MTGVPPSGPGHSPSGLSQSPLSQAQPSVPNAMFTPGPTPFVRMVRNNIHECAPDDSIERITVGALREAATAMQMLYEGASDTVEALVLLRIGLADDAQVVAVIDAHIDELKYALAKARGDQ